MRDLASHLRLWPVAILGLTADLGTKYWAFHHLEPSPNVARTLIPGLVSLRRTLNDGALFGLGSGLWLVFIVASILALGFVWYLFVHSDKTQRSLHVALACILAGALGNLFDRAFMQADIVRTVHGSESGVIVERNQDGSVRLGAWPDGANPRRIPGDEIQSIRRQGVVRDFIKVEPRFGFDVWPWVFNVADVLLVIGVGLLLLNFWRERREARAHAAAAPESSPNS